MVTVSFFEITIDFPVGIFLVVISHLFFLCLRYLTNLGAEHFSHFLLKKIHMISVTMRASLLLLVVFLGSAVAKNTQVLEIDLAEEDESFWGRGLRATSMSFSPPPTPSMPTTPTTAPITAPATAAPATAAPATAAPATAAPATAAPATTAPATAAPTQLDQVTQAPTMAPTRPRTDRSLMVGVYYYPWHTDDFHNNEGFLRKKLVPRQEPELGLYNDREPAVIRQHLQWCMDSNIFLWVMSWWGIDSREDITTQIMLDYMESQPSTNKFPISEFRTAILYETAVPVSGKGLGHIKPDFKHIAKNFFDRPSTFRIDGKPVVVVYLTRVLENLGLLSDAVRLMREGAAEEGYPDIYIVGDHAFHSPTNLPTPYEPFDHLDAVTNYDVYGAGKSK